VSEGFVHIDSWTAAAARHQQLQPHVKKNNVQTVTVQAGTEQLHRQLSYERPQAGLTCPAATVDSTKSHCRQHKEDLKVLDAAANKTHKSTETTTTKKQSSAALVALTCPAAMKKSATVDSTKKIFKSLMLRPP
jgi:hypothetical protein